MVLSFTIDFHEYKYLSFFNIILDGLWWEVWMKLKILDY